LSDVESNYALCESEKANMCHSGCSVTDKMMSIHGRGKYEDRSLLRAASGITVQIHDNTFRKLCFKLPLFRILFLF
jgi:hypothetical protein